MTLPVAVRKALQEIKRTICPFCGSKKWTYDNQGYQCQKCKGEWE